MKQKERTTIPFNKLGNGPFLIRLAMLIGRILPRKWGLKLASFIGTVLGSNKNISMVKAVRANQYVIHHQQLSEKDLDELPKTVFRSAAKCLFDYFYYLSRPEKLEKIVNFSPEAEAAFKRIRNKQPCIIVCPHLSNFDLMGYALALNGVEVQVLSFPNPNASYKLQNRLRKSVGMTVTPMSLSAFRQAQHRLHDGGSILTGFDRPLGKAHLEKYQPAFFGYETNLPVAYVRMAKEAGAPVFIMAATSQPDGTYYLEGSDPIWMESSEDLETEILTNANKVLKEAEGLIMKYAHQWAMFYPIWPQFLDI
jgi:KDO2-lipid IV(A) lauroyltransferase